MRRLNNAPEAAKPSPKFPDAIPEPPAVHRWHSTSSIFEAFVDEAEASLKGSDPMKIGSVRMSGTSEVLAPRDFSTESSGAVVPQPALSCCSHLEHDVQSVVSRAHPSLYGTSSEFVSVDSMSVEIRSSMSVRHSPMSGAQNPSSKGSDAIPKPTAQRRSHYNLGVLLKPPKFGHTSVGRHSYTLDTGNPLYKDTATVPKRIHLCLRNGGIVPCSRIYPFSTRYGFPVYLFKRQSSWRARIMDIVKEEVPVVCLPKRDVGIEVRELCNGPRSLAMSRLHVVDRDGLRVLFLGLLGLMGGGTENQKMRTTSKKPTSLSDSASKALESLVLTSHISTTEELIDAVNKTTDLEERKELIRATLDGYGIVTAKRSPSATISLEHFLEYAILSQLEATTKEARHAMRENWLSVLTKEAVAMHGDGSIMSVLGVALQCVDPGIFEGNPKTLVELADVLIDVLDDKERTLDPAILNTSCVLLRIFQLIYLIDPFEWEVWKEGKPFQTFLEKVDEIVDKAGNCFLPLHYAKSVQQGVMQLNSNDGTKWTRHGSKKTWKVLEDLAKEWRTIQSDMMLSIDLLLPENANNALDDDTAENGSVEKWFVWLYSLKKIALDVMDDEEDISLFFEMLSNLERRAKALTYKQRKHLRYGIAEQLAILSMSGHSETDAEIIEERSLGIINSQDNEDGLTCDLVVSEQWSNLMNLVDSTRRKNRNIPTERMVRRAKEFASSFVDQGGLGRDDNKLFFGSIFGQVIAGIGCTRLVIAARDGNLDTVKWLVANGASIARTDNYGWTPLYSAARNGHLDTVKWLVANGASIDRTNNDGRTPLFSAAQNGQLDTVKWLVANGASIARTDNYGWTPLYSAARNGHLDTVKWLVANGALIDCTNNDGCTPLFSAALNGHLDTAKWLVANGASIDCTSNYGWTPLSFAAQNGNVEMVWFFLLNGAAIDRAMKSSMMPHVIAVMGDHFKTFVWLSSKSFRRFQELNSTDNATLEVQSLDPMNYSRTISPALTRHNVDVSALVFNLMCIHQKDKWGSPPESVRFRKSLVPELSQTLFETKIGQDDMFSICRDVSKVLVTGMLGSGKSSFVRKLSFDWSKGDWGVEFTNIFLIPFRFLLIKQNFLDEINKKPSLAVAITNILGLFAQSSNRQMLQAFVKEELAKSSTLVILDGLEVAKRDPTGNIEVIIKQANNGKHKLLMLADSLNCLEYIPEPDIAAEVSNFYEGRCLAKILVEGGSSLKRAEECIQREKYTANFAEELLTAVSALGVEGSHRGIKKLLMAIDSGDKDLCGLQHLVLKTKIMEQWLCKAGATAYATLEKQFPVLDPLATWLKRGMEEVRNENQLPDDTLLKAVTGLLHDVPLVVSQSKLPLLSQVLIEMEERRWKVDPSLVEALAQILITKEEHRDNWVECMKKGLRNIVGETRGAAIQCIDLLSQFSKKLVPHLLDLLLTTCTRDKDRDCTTIELLHRAPECVVQNFEELLKVCKSIDCRVQRATIKAIPEIAKNVPECITKLASKLLETCDRAPQTVSAGVLDVLGICAEESHSLVDDIVTTLLRHRKEMGKEQCSAMAKAFIRVVRATPDKAIEIVDTLLNDACRDSRASSFRMVKMILGVVGEIPHQQADSMMDLVRLRHQHEEENVQTLALVLEAIRHVVKGPTKSLPDLISTVRNALKHTDGNIRILAFCAAGAIARHRPEELDENLVEAVIRRCKNEGTKELRCSALEAAAEFPSSETNCRDLLPICWEALSDENAEMRDLAGKIITKAASENVEERDRILGYLLRSHRSPTNDTEQGIVHCLHLLVQKIPETFLALQFVLINATASPIPSLASEAVSGLLTIASHEHGNVDQLLFPLNKACERKEHSICFSALDALTVCIRRDCSHREELLASLKKVPKPMNNREWLIYLRALQVMLEDPREDAKECLETLLADWKDKHPHVRQARKKIVDHMSLTRLLHWFEVSGSDLVVHYISRRLLQASTVLIKTDSSLKLRVHSKQGRANYQISKELLNRLRKNTETFIQSGKGYLRQLLNTRRRRLSNGTTVIIPAERTSDSKHQGNLIKYCRKLLVKITVSGGEDSNEGRLITSHPINDLSKIVESGLKLDLHGLSGDELEQLERQQDIQSVLIDGGFLRYDRNGNADFFENIPRHFTEKFLCGPTMEIQKRRAEAQSVEDENCTVEYAVIMSFVTRKVGREFSDKHHSSLQAIQDTDSHKESCVDRKETPGRTSLAIPQPRQLTNLFAERYILQDKIIPRKEHIKFAYDPHSEKTVVLKFYKSKETFENARDMHDGLDPRYVCRKLGEVEEPGFPPCLVFEKAEHSLEDCMNDENWTDDAKKPCLHQILLCLDHLNKRDVVHCDVKPSNILFFLPSHSWKLADLDNARLASYPAPISYSPTYAAPEVLLAEEKGLSEIVLDPSTDMWSFGIVAFEVLSRKRFYGRSATLDRVRGYLCDRTRSLPSLEYIEESQIKRLIENLLVFDPHERWSTKRALDNATFQPADDSVLKAASSQETQIQQHHIDQIADTVTESVTTTLETHVCSALEQVNETLSNTRRKVEEVHQAIGDVIIITSSTLHEIELANLTVNFLFEEFQKPDVDASFELREAKEALMIKDDYLEDPLFVLRLNDAYRVKVSLRHQNRQHTKAYRIRSVSVELPNRMQRLEVKPLGTSSGGDEVVALLSPKEFDFESMLHCSKQWGNSEEKYAQLKIVIELENSEVATGITKLPGTVYCKMVSKRNPLLFKKTIKNVTELWEKCPQWIRSGARGAVILAKVAIPAVAAVTVGDASGAVMFVEAVKQMQSK